MRALHFTVCKALLHHLSHGSHIEALGGSQAGIVLPLSTGEETESQDQGTGPWQSRDPAPTPLLPAGAALPARCLLLFSSRGSGQEAWVLTPPFCCFSL